MPIYIPKYSNFPEYVRIGEYIVPLPDPPNDSRIRGYRASTSKQKFNITTYRIQGKEVPVNKLDHKGAFQSLSEIEQNKIFDQEMKRRKEGEWYFINGQRIYVPGSQYFFCNYWFLDNRYPEWRDSNWLAFLLLENSMKDPRCLFLQVLKGRRKAWTSMANCIQYDLTSRLSGFNAGIISKTREDAAQNNFAKIVRAHNKMPSMFRPIQSGSDIAKTSLDFSPPSEINTAKKLREGTKIKKEALFSKLDFRSTKATAYDGFQLGWLNIDEFGKWENIDPNNTIEVHKLCFLSGTAKRGFGAAFSTVEEISDEQLNDVTRFWNESSPEGETDDWCSANWGRRYMEPFYIGLEGYIDEFGFSKVDEAKAYWARQVDSYKRQKKLKKMTEFIRKHPRNIDDVLTPSGSKCHFDKDILIQRRKELVDMAPGELPIRGDLIWKEKGRSVIFVPRPLTDDKDEKSGGRWVMFKKPDAPNNNIISGGLLSPGQTDKYVIGFDPIDMDLQDTHEGSVLSDGAFAVKRLFDVTIDGGRLDSEDNPVEHGRGCTTGITHCIYRYRPDFADDLYDDLAKTCVFFGAAFLGEAQKINFKRWFVDNQLYRFVLTEDGRTLSRKNMSQAGMPSSKRAKDQYFEKLSLKVWQFGYAFMFIEEIDELLQMQYNDMKKYDLGVSLGYAEIADFACKDRIRTGTSSTQKLVLRRKRISSQGGRTTTR